ncbi:MAG: putative photosynthetic complex assembly protein PuhE [Woeseiaceae bacterium]
MDYLLPILFVVAVWWLSTVVLLYRAGLPQSTYPATLAGAAVLAAVGLVAVVLTRDNPDAGAAYGAFAAALAVWAFLETSYLLGFVTGPRPQPCPPDTTMAGRFGYGIRACLYHELTILATAALLAALTWNAVNRVALWTFVIVWLMRWSTKLNIFLGVRNLRHEFWPGHLQYLQSYARQRTMNPLFPWSMLVALLLIGMLAGEAVGARHIPAERTGAMLLATILALAALEHLFLMLRLPDDALWRLGTRARDV